MAKVADTPFAPAVMVAACVALTAFTLAVKDAVVADSATVTDDGTVTARLLLARAIVNPPAGAAWVSVTVQISEPEPVKLPLLQVRVLSVAVTEPELFTPLPWSLTLEVLIFG